MREDDETTNADDAGVPATESGATAARRLDEAHVDGARGSAWLAGGAGAAAASALTAVAMRRRK